LPRIQQANAVLDQIKPTEPDAPRRVALAVNTLNNRDAYAAIQQWLAHNVPPQPGAWRAVTPTIWAERKRLRHRT
jgi:hypothetical protein